MLKWIYNKILPPFCPNCNNNVDRLNFKTFILGHGYHTFMRNGYYCDNCKNYVFPVSKIKTKI